MLLRSRVLPVRRADLTAIDWLDNVRSSTTHSPLGLHGLLLTFTVKLLYLISKTDRNGINAYIYIYIYIYIYNLFLLRMTDNMTFQNIDF
jgi:hypothetical protein